MARNGSGTYTKINTFVSNNAITAAGHNQNWDDLVTEVTNSVAADGQTTMTGPLKASAGTVSAPGVTFASDTNTGIYRIGADNLGVTVNGAKVLDVATTGLDVTGTINSSGAVKQAGFSLLPPGVIFPYGGTSAPSGYLFCYGQSLLRSSYADLFTAIGTTYGAADGTHFTLPDLRGRVVAGKDDMGGSSANRLTSADDGLNGDTLGATGGGETQTLVTANLPAYTPSGTVGISDPGHSHGNIPLAGGVSPAGAGYNSITGTTSTSSATTGITASFTGAAQGGSSTAFGIVQPTHILNYIIFAGV